MSGKALPHWRDIRAMCGFTAKAYEVAWPDRYGKRPDLAEGLWFVATQTDITAMYQEHGARCKELYEMASDIGSMVLCSAVLQKAVTHFASSSLVSPVTIGIETTFTVGADGELRERMTRIQHKWRFLDATRMQAGLLREDVREAFEAIWMAGEWAAAYEYIDTLTLNRDMLQRED